MNEILEAAMVICFGLSWPMSIYKSITARTAKGKSIIFLCLIFIGYICGIAAKLLAENVTYVLIFYVINLIMVGADIALYLRNRKLDKLSSVTRK